MSFAHQTEDFDVFLRDVEHLEMSVKCPTMESSKLSEALSLALTLIESTFGGHEVNRPQYE